MRTRTVLLLLVLAIGWPASVSAGTVKTFTLKDGTTITGAVIDEGETHYLVKTDDGETVRVPYSEVDAVEADASPGANDSAVPPNAEEPVDPDHLREKLQALLGHSTWIQPSEVTVLKYGIRVDWGIFNRADVFCPGVIEKKGLYYRCSRMRMKLAAKTTHWSEMAPPRTIGGDIEFSGRVKAGVYCVAISARHCLAVTREKETAQEIADLVRALSALDD